MTIDQFVGFSGGSDQWHFFPLRCGLQRPALKLIQAPLDVKRKLFEGYHALSTTRGARTAFDLRSYMGCDAQHDPIQQAANLIAKGIG